jgi:putative ABC transport system permease protein
LGELALLTALSLPLGMLLGWGLGVVAAGTIDSEVYRFPLVVSPQAFARACLGVLVAAALSSLAVRRRLDRLDLVAALKVPE